MLIHLGLELLEESGGRLFGKRKGVGIGNVQIHFVGMDIWEGENRPPSSEMFGEGS